MAYGIWSWRQEALELEPGYDLAVSLAAGAGPVDEPETTGEIAGIVSIYCGRRITGRRSGQLEPVEDVEELSSNLESHLLLDWEAATEAQVLRNIALPAIVVVEPGRESELSCRRVSPGVRVQNQVPRRINAASIGVFQEKWLARNAVLARAHALAQQRREIVI